MNDQEIENEIQAKGKTAPRITPADIEANIHHIETVKHITQSGQVMRWAVLVTQSGFAVVGKPSVAVSPENDDAELGEKVAFGNSKDEMWPLMGYALKQRLHEQAAPVTGIASTVPPHEQRVIDEQTALDGNRTKLKEFFETTVFAGLEADEQRRLRDQLGVMSIYSDILTRRIAAFPPQAGA